MSVFLRVVQFVCVLVALAMMMDSCVGNQTTLGDIGGIGVAAVFAVFARMAQAEAKK